MNGVGKVRLQFIISLMQSIFHIPLAIILANNFGVYGVIAAMILWTFINSIWEPIQFKKIIASEAFGIWNK